MKVGICLVLFLAASCASTRSPIHSNDFKSSAFREGKECSQRRFEVFWLASVIAEKQKWFLETNKTYSSSLESLVGELNGELRYNALFLRTEPRDEMGWSFYTPSTAPRRHQHNLFRSIAREDNDLLLGNRRRVWIDSKFRTVEFTENDLAKNCPDCVVSKEQFKVGIVAKSPEGRVDLWVLSDTMPPQNLIDGCN